MHVIELINTATGHLKEQGFENARFEVECLLCHVLEMSRLDLYLKFDRPVTEDEREKFRELYRRRLAHEPLQYLVGSTGFREIEIKTDKRALIPRPETEQLVDYAVEYCGKVDNPLIADIGTGSGVIALSVVYEVPGAKAVAVDISDDALILAQQNAHRHGLDDRITFVSGDMLTGLLNRGPFDAVISNPPYIESGQIELLQPEVREHEPLNALDGGTDGDDFLAEIAKGAHEHLKPGGLLLMECEGDQADRIIEIINATGKYENSETIYDLAGKKRIVKALKKS